MKRIIAIIAALFILLFTGCSSSSGTVTTITESPNNNTAATAAVKDDNSNSDFLPLEAVQFGYSVDNGYLFYSVVLHNPNQDRAVEFPSFRIIARDSEEALIGSGEQTLSIIYPGQEFAYASQGFSVDAFPAKVEIEVLKPDDYNILTETKLQHPVFKPLTVLSASLKEDRIIGEIQNDNDYDLDMAVVSVIFKDSEGNPVGGECTFVDKVSANSSAPYEILVYAEFNSQDYEVYANQW